MQSIVPSAALVFTVAATACVPEPDHEKVGYVFSSFTGDGEDGLHLLASDDGTTWRALFDYETVHRQSEGLMRDPCITRGPDGRYTMVWTTGWFEETIGVAHSDDLLEWTEMTKLHLWGDYTGPGGEEADANAWRGDRLDEPAERHPLVRNCWAPDIFHDARLGEYVIIWATTIDSPEVFGDTWDPDGAWNGMNHRQYCVTTTDFVRFTPRRFFYAPPDHSVIDATVVGLDDGTYRMVVKDERSKHLHVLRSTRPLTSWSEIPDDFWSDLDDSPPFAGPSIEGIATKAEGATILPHDDGWLIFCDYYEKQRNGVFFTRDFERIEDVTDTVRLPRWVRHGTALTVPKKRVDELTAASESR